MAAPSIVPSVPVTLDKTRHIRFDKLAYFEAEPLLTRLWGRPMTLLKVIQDLLQALTQGDLAYLSVTNLSALLWLGCRHEDRDLTLEQVQDLLPYNDPAALLPIAAAIVEAWQVQTPTTAPTEATNGSDPLGGGLTGTPSGALSALASA